jgi:2-methylcitrate dehydratase PrpD
MLNSAMGHARDYDDTHDGALNHGCVTLVPALLALAEFLGSGGNGKKPPAGVYKKIPFRTVGGREFLAALAVGLEVVNRLGMAFIPYLHIGQLPTTLWGPIGVALACSRLLRLDRTQTANAAGLAYSQIHGNRQALLDGTLAKRLQPGFSVAAGLQAAVMALHGLTGACSLIDGAFGIPALYTGGKIDERFLLEDLGSEYEALKVSIKPYPACRCTHPLIDGILQLKEKERFRGNEVAEGLIRLPPQSMGQIGNPFRIRDNPTVDAQFNAQYTAALSCLEGRPVLKHFEADYVRGATKVRELAARFQVEPFEPDAPGLVPVEVELGLHDGRRLSARIEDPKGSSTNTLSSEELHFKVNDCLDNSLAPPSDGQRDKLIEAIENTQELEDIQKLIEML